MLDKLPNGTDKTANKLIGKATHRRNQTWMLNTDMMPFLTRNKVI